MSGEGPSAEGWAVPSSWRGLPRRTASTAAVAVRTSTAAAGPARVSRCWREEAAAYPADASAVAQTQAAVTLYGAMRW
ncbi:hypothetical protein RKD19_003478 [Streptomyces canus]